VLHRPVELAGVFGNYDPPQIELADKWDELFMTFGHNDG
jgi:hypothetical protein